MQCVISGVFVSKALKDEVLALVTLRRIFEFSNIEQLELRCSRSQLQLQCSALASWSAAMKSHAKPEIRIMASSRIARQHVARLASEAKTRMCTSAARYQPCCPYDDQSTCSIDSRPWHLYG